MNRKSIIEGVSVFVAFIPLILISGCVVGPKVSTYTGDTVQKSGVAVIKGGCFFFLLGYECIKIDRIDGNALEATNVEVLPGMHELEIIDYTFSFFGLAPSPLSPRARLDFNFEPGHEYKIQAHFEGILRKGADIIDVNTGAIITQLWYWDEGKYK